MPQTPTPREVVRRTLHTSGGFPPSQEMQDQSIKLRGPLDETQLILPAQQAEIKRILVEKTQSLFTNRELPHELGACWERSNDSRKYINKGRTREPKYQAQQKHCGEMDRKVTFFKSILLRYVSTAGHVQE